LKVFNPSHLLPYYSVSQTCNFQKEMRSRLEDIATAPLSPPLAGTGRQEEARETLGKRRRQQKAFGNINLPFLILALLALLSSVSLGTAADSSGSDTSTTGTGTDDDAVADTTYESTETSQRNDDDLFQWDESQSFDMVSVLPTSCLN
jgi:hypothetical protein